MPIRILFLLLVFLIPLGTRITLFASEPLIEYQSGFLYVTDLLLAGFVVTTLIGHREKIVPHIILRALLFGMPVLLVLMAFLSILAGGISLHEAYSLVRLVLYVLFFLSACAIPIDSRSYLLTLVAAGCVQAAIAVAQFALQHDLGLAHIEAGPLNTGIDGVAEFRADHGIFLRAYGTFPHPNTLALFLSICLIAWWYTAWEYVAHSTRRLLIEGTAGALLVTGFMMTFSRAYLAIMGAGFLFLLLTALRRGGREWIQKAVILGASAVVLSVLLLPELSARFSLSANDTNLAERAFYSDAAFGFIREHPLLGVGLGNFTTALAQKVQSLEMWMLQPAHNVYLLVASEIGVAGFLVLCALLAYSMASALRSGGAARWSAGMIALLILSGLFDHSLWTLGQGQLLFWVILAHVAKESGEYSSLGGSEQSLVQSLK